LKIFFVGELKFCSGLITDEVSTCEDLIVCCCHRSHQPADGSLVQGRTGGVSASATGFFRSRRGQARSVRSAPDEDSDAFVESAATARANAIFWAYEFGH
jgi:hypothetical protein